MFDELNPAAEYTYPSEQEQTAPEQNVENQQDTTTQESKKDINTRNLRERAESAERRTRELEYMIQQNMSQQQGNKIKLVEEEDDFDVSDDTYIEGKHLKKHIKKLKQKNDILEKKFVEFAQKNEATQAEIQLKNRFNDFDSVVNTENLKKLQYQKPELYNIIVAAPHLYDKGHAAYEMIKNSGILNHDYEDVDRRIEQNKSKPRSASNAAPQQGDTPLAHVGDFDRRVLSPERKQEILKRSLEFSGKYQ